MLGDAWYKEPQPSGVLADLEKKWGALQALWSQLKGKVSQYRAERTALARAKARAKPATLAKVQAHESKASTLEKLISAATTAYNKGAAALGLKSSGLGLAPLVAVPVVLALIAAGTYATKTAIDQVGSWTKESSRLRALIDAEGRGQLPAGTTANVLATQDQASAAAESGGLSQIKKLALGLALFGGIAWGVNHYLKKRGE